MTDELHQHDDDETTTTTRRSVRQWLADLARSLWTPTKTRPIGLIAAGLIVLVGGIVILHRLQHEADARVAAVGELNAQNLYVLELQDWSDQVAARDLCVDSVARSLDNRAGWQQIVTILTGANLPQYAAMVQAGPVLSKPARSTDECGDAPTRPTPPPAITAAVDTTPTS